MTYETEKDGRRLGAQTMCDRLATEFEDGWIVNLGAGIATLCSNFDFQSKTVLFHSENGILGYGSFAREGEEDVHLTNASNEYVTLLPGAAIVDHADSFAIIRGGHLDAVVMGAYEVAENGDFANWKTKGRRGGGIGGAMDLGVGAKRVFIVMKHTTKDGQARLRVRCTLPITAPNVVTLVCTDLALIEVSPHGFLLKEIAPGFTPEEVQSVTEARLLISDALKEVETYS